MPTYEYACQSCGHELEVFQRMSDDALTDCPSCSTSSLKRKIGLGAGIIFKGGGFYETDFKDRKGSPSGSSEPAAKAPAKKETKPAKKDSSGG
jgi:putative FmdB family regulatory protein